METRKITIISTKTQSKKVINTNAITLGELKDELDNNNIDYEDMTFHEGLSKTDMTDNAAVLPHDIEYRGKVTNDLVFMLTNTNKKIKSGATDRIALYDYIKKNGLAAAIKHKYGKNFTCVKTVELQAEVDAHEKNNDTVAPLTTGNDCENHVVDSKEAEEDSTVTLSPEVKNYVNGKLNLFIEALRKACTIDDYDEDDIKEAVFSKEDFNPKEGNSKKVDDSPYSEDEINEMFSNM